MHDATLSLPQAALQLGLPYNTVYSLLLSGRIAGRQVAGRWRLNATSVAALVSARENVERLENERATEAAAR